MPKAPRNVVRLSGRWYYRAQVQGRRMLWPLGPFLDDTARARAEQLRRQLEAGIVPPRPGDVPALAPETAAGTVAAFSKRWLTERIIPERHGRIRRGGQVNGLALAEQRLRDHVLPVLGELQLGEVRRADLLRLRASLVGKQSSRKRPLSLQTIGHILSDVRCMLRYAAEVELIDAVPTFSRLLPRVPERAPDHLSDVAVTKILEAASPAQASAIRISLLTGIRWGELQRLDWHSVQLHNDPHLVIQHTKSGKVRRIPLSQEAAYLLRTERETSSSVHVCRIRARIPGNVVARIAEKTGFSWHWHQLRHTFAHRWLRDGGSKEALRLILGHSTIRLTERYGQLTDQLAFDETTRLGRKPSEVASKWQPEVQDRTRNDV